MISKIFPGHSFYHACRYVCQDTKRALVLVNEGVRGHDYRLMAQDFIRQHEMRPAKTKACFHSILSFYPGENPGDEKMIRIAKEYLTGIGIVNTQYSITKHIDKDHLHLHILANMVGNDGRSISDSWIALKGKKIAQRLTLEHQLTQGLKKDLTLTHMESLTQSEAKKYKIYMAISSNLPNCRTMKDLETALLKNGIQTQYKYKGQTLEKQGVSFKIDNDCFKGSKVDRRFSYANLQRTIKLNLKQTQGANQETPLSSDAKDRKPFNGNQINVKTFEKDRSQNPTGDLEKVLDILMRPEQTPTDIPYQLTEEERRKRKRQSQKRSRGL